MYSIPSELNIFKQITCHTISANRPNLVVMGNNTFRSMNSKPLKDRFNCVLSKNAKYLNDHNDHLNLKYFMSINEAAQLVIQAAKLALGGDLFVLDMGSPVKITELAEQMVTLSGLKLKDESNKDGDIEIVFTGLRPGEKLYEELLIDAECLKTSHPLIFRALEKSIKSEKLWEKLNDLQIAIEEHNHDESIKILSELVPQWKRNNDP